MVQWGDNRRVKSSLLHPDLNRPSITRHLHQRPPTPTDNDRPSPPSVDNDGHITTTNHVIVDDYKTTKTTRGRAYKGTPLQNNEGNNNNTRRGLPLLVLLFSTATTQGGVTPPLLVFFSTATTQGGVFPSSSFSFRRRQHEGREGGRTKVRFTFFSFILFTDYTTNMLLQRTPNTETR